MQTVQTLFVGAPKLLQMVTAAMKLKKKKQTLSPGKKIYDQPRQHIIIHFLN